MERPFVGSMTVRKKKIHALHQLVVSVDEAPPPAARSHCDDGGVAPGRALAGRHAGNRRY